MTSQGQHAFPIKNWKQLAVIVVLAFAVPIALGVILSQLMTSGTTGEVADDSVVLKRIQPVGTVVLADATGPKGTLSGEQVYQQVCKTCHEAGLAGAHKFGDKAAWAKVIAQGEALTVEHAIKGFKAMPAKGGNPDLEDVEVRRSVVYMINKAGGNWKEPLAPAATAAAAPVATATAAAPAATTAKPDGRKVYDTACTACHAAGIAGAPKFGDKPDWAARIAQGQNTLYTHAIAGYQGKGGVMPPRGGNASLSDADVKAAVDYMVAAAK